MANDMIIASIASFNTPEICFTAIVAVIDNKVKALRTLIEQK